MLASQNRFDNYRQSSLAGILMVLGPLPGPIAQQAGPPRRNLPIMTPAGHIPFQANLCPGLPSIAGAPERKKRTGRRKSFSGRLHHFGFRIWLTNVPESDLSDWQPVGCPLSEPPLVTTTHTVTSFPT